VPEGFAVTHDVASVVGGQIDRVLIAESDATWGVVHIAAGTSGAGLFILVHDLGVWQVVESGYPQMACDELLPDGVRADVGLLMRSCG
jgi:hypothetical protein